LPHWPQIVANLLEEPWCLRPDEVAKLTPRQVVCFYNRPRNEKGVPRPLPYPGPVDERAEELNFLQVVMGMSPEAAYRKVYGESNGG
jgi:hypothetical protein